jgi:hypothetical protein
MEADRTSKALVFQRLDELGHSVVTGLDQPMSSGILRAAEPIENVTGAGLRVLMAVLVTKLEN